MLLAPNAKDPAILSYFALRKAVGGIALGLPFAVAIPWFLYSHMLEGSISYYYYTGMRNLFEGSRHRPVSAFLPWLRCLG